MDQGYQPAPRVFFLLRGVDCARPAGGPGNSSSTWRRSLSILQGIDKPWPCCSYPRLTASALQARQRFGTSRIVSRPAARYSAMNSTSATATPAATHTGEPLAPHSTDLSEQHDGGTDAEEPAH